MHSWPSWAAKFSATLCAVQCCYGCDWRHVENRRYAEEKREETEGNFKSEWLEGWQQQTWPHCEGFIGHRRNNGRTWVDGQSVIVLLVAIRELELEQARVELPIRKESTILFYGDVKIKEQRLSSHKIMTCWRICMRNRGSTTRRHDGRPTRPLQFLCPHSTRYTYSAI